MGLRSDDALVVVPVTPRPVPPADPGQLDLFGAPPAPVPAPRSGPQADQLGPVSHPTTQLPRRRRGDPRLGQSAHPQQIAMRGIALIVLTRR
jgi:hypothetical protein